MGRRPWSFDDFPPIQTTKLLITSALQRYPQEHKVLYGTCATVHFPKHRRLNTMPAARTVTPSPPASIHTVEVQEEVNDHPSDANERTSLLRTSSRNSGAKVYVNSKHGRVAKPASAARRPVTVEQEAVRVQQGQRVSSCPACTGR